MDDYHTFYRNDNSADRVTDSSNIQTNNRRNTRSFDSDFSYLPFTELQRITSVSLSRNRHYIYIKSDIRGWETDIITP